MTAKVQRLASAVTEHAPLTLAGLEFREHLRRQAIYDALTGLYKRRYLPETQDHESSRKKRKELALGFLMSDLDHFKQFNNRDGHDVGDMILGEFGTLLGNLIPE